MEKEQYESHNLKKKLKPPIEKESNQRPVIPILPEPPRCTPLKNSPPSQDEEAGVKNQNVHSDDKLGYIDLPSTSSIREIMLITKKSAPSPLRKEENQKGSSPCQSEEQPKFNIYPNLPALNFDPTGLSTCENNESSMSLKALLNFKKRSGSISENTNNTPFTTSLSVRALVTPRPHNNLAEEETHPIQKNKERRSKKKKSVGGSLIAERSTQLNLSTSSSEKEQRKKRHKNHRRKKKPAPNRCKNEKEKEKEEGKERKKENKNKISEEEKKKNNNVKKKDNKKEKKKRKIRKNRSPLQSARQINHSFMNLLSPKDMNPPGLTPHEDVKKEFYYPKGGIP